MLDEFLVSEQLRQYGQQAQGDKARDEPGDRPSQSPGAETEQAAHRPEKHGESRDHRTSFRISEGRSRVLRPLTHLAHPRGKRVGRHLLLRVLHRVGRRLQIRLRGGSRFGELVQAGLGGRPLFQPRRLIGRLFGQDGCERGQQHGNADANRPPVFRIPSAPLHGGHNFGVGRRVRLGLGHGRPFTSAGNSGRNTDINCAHPACQDEGAPPA